MSPLQGSSFIDWLAIARSVRKKDEAHCGIGDCPFGGGPTAGSHLDKSILKKRDTIIFC